MRLMQLARQLGKSQQEIVDFLLSQNIEMKLHGNSKVPDEALPLIHEHWAPTAEENSDQPKEDLPAVTNTETPEVEEEILPTTTPQESEASEPNNIEEPLAVTQDTPTPPSQVIEDSETEAEKPEVTVIRAKKVKLEGIKVLGKIDLPEPKPKKRRNPNRRKRNSGKRKNT
ncbi:hypothetical protein LVD15_23695 [Fulvivirga maritima]|uniref:hypothetical protein n=1 Tax=Fulvivirga maritima TaxID=2904247 RepID=UPI001F1615FB|nr:hypothetical protein [Fulvivirga maritima]UII26266.1 hypothetical protein LVD15_23695 [Fulvivirga maritima]